MRWFNLLNFFLLFAVVVLCFNFNTHIKNVSRPNNKHWEIYYGEVNSIYSYVQIGDTNFILNTTEFIFIDGENKGYCNLDTSSISKADSLIPIKLAQVQNLKKGDDNFQRIEKIQIDSSSFYIKLLESKRGTTLYKLEKNKQQYYLLKEYAFNKKDTLPVMWTGRDNRNTKTRTFKIYNRITK